jgi:hypothetical protein
MTVDAEADSASVDDAPHGRGFVPPVGILILAVLLAAGTVLALYSLWAFWPSEGGKPGTGVAPRKSVHYFWTTRALSRESLFFVMVAMAGALGGMVHSVKSLSWYVGNRMLRWSWVPFYLLKPLLGASMATVLYFIIRAGFFSPSASTSQTSPYGFAAVSALAGLFSDQAVEKLRKVAAELFEEAEQGKDAIGSAPDATVEAPTAITGTSAVLTGTVNPRGHETAYQFEWGQTTEYGSKAPSEPENVGASLGEKPVSQRISGLQPGRQYHCRLVAVSDAGTSKSSDQAFETPGQ